MFDEEQYSVRTLAKLWEEVIDILEDRDSSFAGLSDNVETLYDSESPEENIFNLLIKELKQRNKKLVLLLDNFGEMTQKFTKKETQRLREILITCNYIRIIGASSTVLEFYYDYKEPFFDFFKVVTLDELTRDETISLLKRLSETYGAGEIEEILAGQPERIEAIIRLTGGVPRTIVLLYEIFVDDVDGSSIKDLETILDRVTPLYKHRLDNLSTQQQAIIDAIAQNWDAISTKEISDAVRMPSKAVSSQLNQLEKSQLISKISTSTKNKLYQVNERFFNIYYLMRLGKRRNRNRVLWLIKFFEIWCGESELIERAQKHIGALKKNILYEKHALYITQALSRTDIPYPLQHGLITETRKYLTTKQSEYCEELEKSHIEIYDEVVADIKNDSLASAKRKLINDGAKADEIDFSIGEIFRKEIKDLDSAKKYYLKAVEKDDAGAMYNLALLYESEFKDFDNAVKYYMMAVEKDHINAIFNLALLYEIKLKDPTNAEKYYLMAIAKDDSDAMYNLALLYENEFTDFDNAVKYYLMAVGKDHASAMYNLALLYENEFTDFDNAVKYYLMAVKKEDPGAMNNLAVLYQSEFKDFDNAKKYYLMAVEKNHTDAMFNLALLYQFEFKDFDNAINCYLMAAEKEDTGAMNNLALLYQSKFKDFDNAKKYYLMAVEKGDVGAMYNLALLYQSEFKDFDNAKKYYVMAVEKDRTEAMNNLALLYHTEFKDFDNAKKYYLMAVEKDHAGAMYNLAWLYQSEFKDFDNAKKYYLTAVEKNYVSAMNDLGLLYELEFKDFDNAKKYYLMAVEKDHADAMHNLAVLYEAEFKDFDNAIKYYLIAVEKGNFDAMNNLAWLYYEQNKNKIEAYKLVKRAYADEQYMYRAHSFIIISLWNDEIEEAIETYKLHFEKEKEQKDVNETIQSILLMFIAKSQYNFVYKLFKENKFEIRDKYKPVYYALLTLMGDKYKDELKKQGSELKETVAEVISKIHKLAEDY